MFSSYANFSSYIPQNVLQLICSKQDPVIDDIWILCLLSLDSFLLFLSVIDMLKRLY